MPKIIAKRLRVRRDKDSPWSDIPAAVVRKTHVTQETDPTVPDWAKQPDKPTYTKAEVGLGNVDNARQYSENNPPPYPVQSVNGKTGAVSLVAADVGARPSTWTPTASDVGALPASTKIPAKTSDLQNDSGFITRLVADLVNYPLKSDVYSRKEINEMLSAIPKFSIEVVTTLPTSNISDTTVYLVSGGSGSDLYVEYIHVKGSWEILGSQRVDLTGYATEAWVLGKLGDYLKTTDLQTAINEALALAKASGEFDGEAGAPGVSPHIGGNGNWYIGDEDTGVKAKGAPGEKGRGIASIARTSGTGAAGTTDTYTITYTDNTTSAFVVYNGKDGTPYTLTDADKQEIAEAAAKTVDVPDVDDTLKVPGAAADAAKVGAEISNLSTAFVDYRAEVNEYKEEVNNLPNNETLIENVAEKVPFVKSPENPVFVTSEDDMTDSSRLYVYNGFIYQHGKHTEIGGGGGLVPTFTNLKEQCVIKTGYRYSLSGGGFKTDNATSSVVVPVPTGITSVVIRIKGVTWQTNYPLVYGGASSTSLTTELGKTTGINLDDEEIYTVTLTKDSAITWINFHVSDMNESDFDDMIVTVNEPIEYREESTEIEVIGFYNTGCAFVPADYEEIILQLEKDIEKLESQIGTVNESSIVHNSVGTTFPPSQKPATTEFSGYDLDLLNTTANEIYAYIDEVKSDGNFVTKEILGKDASGKYDIARYIYANREYIAWQKQNHPKMYAWKNGSTVIYSTSVSPRIGDTMYSTAYIGTAYSAVTAVSATNRTRTVNELEFVRYESGDIEPTVIYTDKDDSRNTDASITENGTIYNRYPLGDLGENRTKLIPIFTYANEHGVIKDTTTSENHEGKIPALIAARLLRDLVLGKQENNPLYKYIREHCMLIIIPVANPFGFNFNLTTDTNGYTGYYNANTVNINRNYDTPGWDYMKNNNTGSALGSYAGSEIETQYIMNTMVESGAVVAMSLHGYPSGDGNCAHQGQNPGNVDYNQEKLSKIHKFLKANWGYGFIYYDGEPLLNTPDITSKSPSYITQCGAYGGIVEMSPDDNRTSGLKHEANRHVCENAYAQVLNVTAMWLSDYLENI